MPNETQRKSNDIGCIWKHKSQKDGSTYLSGVINLKDLGFDRDVQIVAFKNDHKQKETHPDLRIYLSKARVPATDSGDADATPAAPPAKVPAQAPAKAKAPPVKAAATDNADGDII